MCEVETGQIKYKEKYTYVNFQDGSLLTNKK